MKKPDDTRFEMARRHSSGSRLQRVSGRRHQGQGFQPRPNREEFQKSIQAQFDEHSKAVHSPE
jgi:hypothetical protein